MQTPLSFCDITARYGQLPAPQQTLAEQTGWDPQALFRSYLTKVRKQRDREEKEAIEDALMELVDAANAPRWERTADHSLFGSLLNVSEEQDGRSDGTENPAIQAILAMVRAQAAFRQVDSILEEQETDTAPRPSEPGSPSAIEATERR